MHPGRYLYVGSAFGPGGLAARVGRHWRADKPLRWHIDYLRQVAALQAVWFSTDGTRLEHRWAEALTGRPGIEPIVGFGCSDCACPAHLFRARDTSVAEAIRVRLPGDVHYVRINAP